jgi:hypothetical protein
MKTLFRILLVVFSLLVIFISHFFYTRINIYQSYDVKLENVLAFTEKVSVKEGEPILLKIHSKEDCFGQLFKIKDSISLVLDSIEIEEFNQSDNYNPIVGFAWRTNLIISTDSLSSGYYLFKVVEKKNSENLYYHPILITPKKAGKISIISSTNTWQSYNSYAGRSNYVDEVSPSYYQKIISFFPSFKPITYCSDQRPFSFMLNVNNILNVDVSEKTIHTGLITELDTFGIHKNPIISYDTIPSYLQHFFGEQYLIEFMENNSINYGVYSDFDFAYNTDVYDSELIIFHMHSEYWSQEMIGKLETYCAQGGHVIFASGNNMYREVEFYEKGIKIYGELDPFLTRSLTGTSYTEITYPKSSSYVVNSAKHWAYSGCGLENGDTVFHEGSGWETDKIGHGSKDFEVLATGLNRVGPAQMVIKEYENGGWVFNASSMTFTQSLNKDEKASKILLNLINKSIENDSILE